MQTQVPSRAEVRDALAGIVGLVQLIASRNDLPQGLEFVKTNHRYALALEVLEAIDASETHGVNV